MSGKRYQKEIVYVDPDFLDLIPGFLESRRKEITAIRNCIGSGDMKEVHRLGHGMKGAGAGYGFAEISEIGSRLEAAAKDGDTAVLRDEIDRLEEYLSAVEVVPGDPE